MSATITMHRRNMDSGEPTCLSTAVVVLVAPRGMLSDCDLAIAGALSRGARAFTCEVPTEADGDVCDDGSTYTMALEAIAATLDQAESELPGLPIVLVGHAEAAVPARLYADLCPGDLAGVVLTKKSNHLDAA
ncbi:hypothetical protein ACIRON_16550 [Nocardioides sp. NPDC101246]|uniref:hypothetical protein n=1 Tax=Nocardioides sp. NPDC101246 TaxID=3364336 RepID=UPI00381C60D6